MSNIIDRLRMSFPSSPIKDEAADTITRLQGEASVMIGLLSEAVAVLQTIEPECAAEDERLTRLRGDIWSVLQAWAKRGGA